jgi:hypothetical protein
MWHSHCCPGHILDRQLIVGSVIWPLRHEYTKRFVVPGGGAAVRGSHETVHAVPFKNGPEPSCPHEPLFRLLKDDKSGTGHAGCGDSGYIFVQLEKNIFADEGVGHRREPPYRHSGKYRLLS